MKKVVSLVLGMMIVITLISGCSQGTKKAVQGSPGVITRVVATTRAVAPTRTKEEQEIADRKVEAALRELIANDNKVEAVVRELEESMGSAFRIEVDKQSMIYRLIHRNDDFTSQVRAAKETGNTEDWNELVESFSELSKYVDEKTPGYYIALINPVNTTRYLLVIQNGRITVDAVYD